MNDLSPNKHIYSLGLTPRLRTSNRLKKIASFFLKKLENCLPFPFNRGLNYFSKKIRYKFITSFHSEELQKIVFFLEKNLATGRCFALYSEGGSGYRIASQIQKTCIGKFMWAHYDAHHHKFDSFSRADFWVGIDHSYAPVDFILFLVSPDRYEIAIRSWKFEYNSPWKIILPYYKSSTITLREWENPTPTLLWIMQFAGAARLGPTFEDLATYFQRTYIKYAGNNSFTARSIANLKSLSSKLASCEIRHHMGQEKHLYRNPEENELTELLYLITKRLPYGTWTSVHEFIDFSKLTSIQDLQSVVLIRDPRDMIISALSSLLNEFDQESFKQQGLLNLAKGGTFGMCPTYFMNWPSIKNLAQSFLSAKKCTNAFTIKFEDIHANPQETYFSLVKWLNWNSRNPISAKRLEKSIFYGTFEYQTNGKLNEGDQADSTKFESKTGQAISARKGASGDWKNHFSKKVKDYVKEQIGNELIELGYEKDLNW